MPIYQIHLFTSLITCECGWRFKYAAKEKLYVCGGYNAINKCSCKKRNKIKEADLIEILKTYEETNNTSLIYTNEQLRTKIKKIYKGMDYIKIEFFEPPHVVISNHYLSYMAEEI